ERRAISRAFTWLMNLLFGTRVRYYTGPCVYRSDVTKRLRMHARGSMFVAELLIRQLRAGQSYVEVGMQPRQRSSGSAMAFRLQNVIDVVRSIGRLFWELQIRRVSERPAPLHVPVPEDDPSVSSH